MTRWISREPRRRFPWALPAVGFHALHLAHLSSFGAKDGDVVLFQNLKDKAGMLTPKITTLYVFSFWNMKEQGPLVVEVPAGATAGGVLDIWQRPLTDTGQTGPEKGQGAKFLILPPGIDDMKPEGYYVVHSSTNQLWFATRGLDPDPKVADQTVGRPDSLRRTAILRYTSWTAVHRLNSPIAKLCAAPARRTAKS